jgi:hypothetical protein
LAQDRPHLSIIRPRKDGDAHNALVYWKSEAQRLKRHKRELEAANKRLQSFLRPFVMGHLKFRAEKRHQLEKLGISDPDSFLQLDRTPLSGPGVMLVDGWPRR